jgi:hypothetical protein
VEREEEQRDQAEGQERVDDEGSGKSEAVVGEGPQDLGPERRVQVLVDVEEHDPVAQDIEAAERDGPKEQLAEHGQGQGNESHAQKGVGEPAVVAEVCLRSQSDHAVHIGDNCSNDAEQGQPPGEREPAGQGA